MSGPGGAPPSSWAASAEGASQAALMQSDLCALVDGDDAVVGSASKWAVHRFEGATPRGQLHRAFSVLLFDRAGRLLLQQRAACKLTFPLAWTNACCSHPLVGAQPPEVDTDPALVAATGCAPGAQRAAVRKLGHELGVGAGQVAAGSLRLLARLRYCAPDDRHPPWGEHELDYVLAGRAPDGLTLAPNPDEVAAVRWVERDELAAMLDPASGLLWSPWFRIIAARFLPAWWDDLDGALGGEGGGGGRHWDPRIHVVM